MNDPESRAATNSTASEALGVRQRLDKPGPKTDNGAGSRLEAAVHFP
jgi:hypothetical protein